MIIRKKGDFGFNVRFDYGVSLADATVKVIRFKKPVSGEVGSFTGLISGTVIYMPITSGVFDEVGDWKFQSIVKTPNWQKSSDWEIITVMESGE